MKKVIADRIKKEAHLVREQERRECYYWSGQCPICKLYIEVEEDDVHYEGGFFGTPAGHYTKCPDCEYHDVPVERKEKL